MKVTTRPHLMPRLRMTAAIALISLYAFIAAIEAALSLAYCACNMQWKLKVWDKVELFVDHAKNDIFIMISRCPCLIFLEIPSGYEFNSSVM